MNTHGTIGALGLTIALLGACASEGGVEPLVVQPGDANGSFHGASGVSTTDTDDARHARASDGQSEAYERGARPVDPGLAGAIWLVDANDAPVGVLVRRGSDDNLVYRAIYDLVTVFHPESGLFFEVTMSDGVTRYPATTFFGSSDCSNPIGISHGGCNTCRSGYGIGLRHDGIWYRVLGGATYEQTSAGSTVGSGVSGACSPHQTSSAKIYPLDEVEGPPPAAAFAPPLRFQWR